MARSKKLTIDEQLKKVQDEYIKTRKRCDELASEIERLSKLQKEALWYLQSYPDVAAANEDPLTHYCKYGWKEKRKPGPKELPVEAIVQQDENPLWYALNNGLIK